MGLTSITTGLPVHLPFVLIIILLKLVLHVWLLLTGPGMGIPAQQKTSYVISMPLQPSLVQLPATLTPSMYLMAAADQLAVRPTNQLQATIPILPGQPVSLQPYQLVVPPPITTLMAQAVAILHKPTAAAQLSVIAAQPVPAVMFPAR